MLKNVFFVSFQNCPQCQSDLCPQLRDISSQLRHLSTVMCSPGLDGCWGGGGIMGTGRGDAAAFQDRQEGGQLRHQQQLDNLLSRCESEEQLGSSGHQGSSSGLSSQTAAAAFVLTGSAPARPHHGEQVFSDNFYLALLKISTVLYYKRPRNRRWL